MAVAPGQVSLTRSKVKRDFRGHSVLSACPYASERCSGVELRDSDTSTTVQMRWRLIKYDSLSLEGDDSA